jgi:hypothetical protein
MKSLKWLGIAAGIAALTACGGNKAEENMANADMNVTADNMALPEDNLSTNVDMNAGMNDTNMTNDTNSTANNTSDNTVNAY